MSKQPLAPKEKPKYKEMHEEKYVQLKNSVGAGWGGAEQATDRENTWNHYWGTWLNAFSQKFSFPSSGKLLELGSGAGNISTIIAKYNYEITGIEVSPTAVELARERNPQVQYFEGSITDLSRFADESFDIVFDGLCIHCIIGEDRKKVFAEIYRVLKRGGYFLLNTICGDPWADWILKDFDQATRCHFVDGVPYRYLGQQESILAELKEQKFEILLDEYEQKSDGGFLRAVVRK